MALGRRGPVQEPLFVAQDEIAQAPAHPFYSRLQGVLERYGFDAFCEALCRPHYAEGFGRPGLPPGVYFRLLLLGYFERIPSERQIAWRVADSMSLRQFIGYSVTQEAPDHSTISKTRRRLPLAVHNAIFTKVLEILATEKLLRGKKLGVDGTTLQANASLRALLHNVSGKSYREYVKSLMAQDPGEPEDPSPADIGRFDRRRKGKKLSNRHWHNAHNPEAKIGKMKDGRTRFIEKCEQAVDLETGAVVAVTVQAGDRGDTGTLEATLAATAAHLEALKETLIAQEPKRRGRPPQRQLLQCVVADKGYHSAAVCERLQGQQIHTVISEPKGKRRKWKGQRGQQLAVYANRVQIRSEAGKQWIRKRGELVERAFTHYLDEGGMRKLWLRGHENIAKRLLVHVAGFNLGLLMRKLLGAATPRAWRAQGGPARANFSPFGARVRHAMALWGFETHLGRHSPADDYRLDQLEPLPLAA